MVRSYVTAYAQVDSSSLSSLSHLKEPQIRDRVRQIQIYPVLSYQWLSLASVLHELAVIAQAERMATDSTSTDFTLWESHHNVLRLLVEESKPHIIISLLNSYKTFMLLPETQGENFRKLVRQKSAEYQISCAQIASYMTQFEEGAGALCEGLLQYSEVFQTINLSSLLEHFALLLSDRPILVLDEQDHGRTQEALVVPYILALVKKLDTLDSTIVEKILEYDLISKLIVHLSGHREKFSSQWYSMGLEALSILLLHEDVETDVEDIVNEDARFGLKEALKFLDRDDLTLDDIQKYRGVRLCGRRLKLV
ncbi:hypothetical protein P9112_007941 [Eukaryota sp. TZLM1-RC]